jgi:HK97 family phage portal protein
MGLLDIFRAPRAAERLRPTILPARASMPRPFVHRQRHAEVRGTLFDNTGFQGGWSLLRGDMPTLYQGTGRNVRVKGWEEHPVVHSCSRAIAELVGAVPIEVCDQLSDGSLEPITDRNHPAVRLLAAPRIGMNPFRLRSLTATHFTTYGNGFWVLEGKNPMQPRGRRELPQALRLIQPEHLHHVWLDPETTEVSMYDWRDRFGLVHHSPARDVIHFMDLSAMDWVFGFPRAASALSDIIADAECSQYVRQVVSNDGAGALVFLHEDGASQDELTAARERWHERRAVRGERGRAEFVGNVKDVKQVGFNLTQLEFPELRHVAREDICTAFGVDPRMIGISNKAQGRSLNSKEFEEARYKLVQHTVKPILELLTSQMNDEHTGLAPEFGDVVFRFAPDKLYDLTENEGETWTRVTAALNTGAIATQEARPRLKLPAEFPPKALLALAKGTSLQTVEDALAPPPAEAALGPDGKPIAKGNGNGNGKNHGRVPAEALAALADSTASGKPVFKPHKPTSAGAAGRRNEPSQS